MADAFKAAFLGFIQGVTEFLPISSSAHLIVLRRVLGFEVEGLAFDLSVHFATLLAVLIYFRGEIAGILRSDSRWAVALRICLATLPLAVLGFLMKDVRENLPAWAPVAGWTFSGFYLLLARRGGGDARYGTAPIAKVLGIGAAQALAIFPGVSRSGSTITAGVLLGISREEAAKFSFLLSILAVLLAVAKQILDLSRSTEPHGSLWQAAGVAMPVAFVTAMLAIHLLLRIVRANFFHRFGWYNLCAAAAFGTYLLAGS